MDKLKDNKNKFTEHKYPEISLDPMNIYYHKYLSSKSDQLKIACKAIFLKKRPREKKVAEIY